MPQELFVIKCFSCETFQVHIVKKSNKWCCKICGEKQSIKKIYYQGAGKECRLQVQFLNQKRITNELLETEACITQYSNTEHETQIIEHNKLDKNNTTQNSSKWAAFLTKESNSSDSDDNQNLNFTFERPTIRKLVKESKNVTKLQKKSDFDSEISQNVNITSNIVKEHTVDMKTDENATGYFLCESKNVFDNTDANNLDELLNFDL